MNKLYRLIPLLLFFSGLLAGMQLSFSGNPIVLVAGFTFLYAMLYRVKHSFSYSLWYSFFFGYGFFLWGHGWISQPLSSFENVFDKYQVWAFIGIPAILSGYFLLVGLLNVYVKSVGHGRVFIFSVALWVAEYLRCYVLPAVPLGQVGTVWFNMQYIAMTASVFGVYGLSFFTYYFSLLVSGAILKDKASFIVCVLIGVMVPAVGYLNVPKTLEKEDFFVRLVPTAWPQTEKYKSLQMRVNHLKELVAKSNLQLSTLKKQPNLVVWPETTVEFSLLNNINGYDFIHPDIKPYLQQSMFAHNAEDKFLLAGIGFKANQTITFNAAMVLNRDGVIYVYNKYYLAPFGEFTPAPLQPLFRLFGLPMLSGFVPGEPVQPLLRVSNLNIRVLICYEGSYSRTLKQSSVPIDMLTVITNDAWFGMNGKEQQFISHAFRAIEEGVSMVRCANSGYSGYILPNGSYYASLTHNPIDIQLYKPVEQTFFSLLAGWCVYWVECVLLLLVVLGLALEVCARRRV